MKVYLSHRLAAPPQSGRLSRACWQCGIDISVEVRVSDSDEQDSVIGGLATERVAGIDEELIWEIPPTCNCQEPTLTGRVSNMQRVLCRQEMLQGMSAMHMRVSENNAIVRAVIEVRSHLIPALQLYEAMPVQYANSKALTPQTWYKQHDSMYGMYHTAPPRAKQRLNGYQRPAQSIFGTRCKLSIIHGKPACKSESARTCAKAGGDGACEVVALEVQALLPIVFCGR